MSSTFGFDMMLHSSKLVESQDLHAIDDKIGGGKTTFSLLLATP